MVINHNEFILGKTPVKQVNIRQRVWQVPARQPLLGGSEAMLLRELSCRFTCRHIEFFHIRGDGSNYSLHVDYFLLIPYYS